ncbi:MAG: MurR/RpiR family transcriptional regulator [Bacillota bacterium]
MAAAVFQIIEEKMNGLSAGHKTIAEYILQNYKDIPSLSAQEIGERIGVSDASVIRFCQTIGLSGYSQLKEEIYEIVKQEEPPSLKMQKTFNTVREKNGAVAQVFRDTLLNVEKTLAAFDNQVFATAVEKLSKANRVYLLGVGSCASLAEFLAFHFKRLGLPVEKIVSGGFWMFETLSTLHPGDVLVVISYPRYSRDTLKSMRFARQKGALVIAITDNKHSPIGQNADLPIIAKSTNPTGFANSYAATMVICDALVLSIALENKEKAAHALANLDEVNKEFDFYL